MATPIVRIPTSNIPMNGDYTGTIDVGSDGQPVSVILDTGSSTLALGLHVYDPARDTSRQVTEFAQFVAYGKGDVGWYGAVLETEVAIGMDSLPVPRCNIAVASAESASMFGKAGGILGLAYISLDTAYRMPGPTWPPKYSSKQMEKLGVKTELAPYFSQLTQATGVADMFAFYALRSWPNLASEDTASDPLNKGWLVLGGGPESGDLYSGEFVDANVVGDDFYDTNLKAVIVGDQPPIPVAPAPLVGPGTPGNSNSIVDSGTNALILDQDLFNQVVQAFTSTDPSFGPLIQQGGTQANGAQGLVLNADVTDRAWPTLSFVLEGAGAADITLAVTPATYWQTDAIQSGSATFTISGGGKGQSILGLPLLNNYFTIFDQTGSGRVRFAPIKPPAA